jgi:SAM-dependent methyltransferase
MAPLCGEPTSYNQGMQAAVAQRLIALNKEFYQTHAANFSATRSRLQPGALRALAAVPPGARVLDLGCGNGGVAAELAQRGWLGQYVGVDFSAELLEEANKKLRRFEVEGPRFKFSQLDLSSPDWAQESAISNLQFDFIFALAVMHHVPGPELRLEFLRQVRGLLAAGGRFVHSNWQFMRSLKLAARVQPWAAASLDAADVDPGDYLLDWRGGGQRQQPALRYVHQFSEAELGELAAASRFSVQESFASDGYSSNLALYQYWVVAEAEK